MKSPDSREPTRRDFLAVTAAGVLELASGAVRRARMPQKQPGGDLLYVGTYTEGGRSDGIHLVRMDARTGELRLTGSVNGGENPSFLALHPDGRVLYAVNEVTEINGRATGAVSALAIDGDTGELTRLNEQLSEGGAPCYVSVDRTGRAALVANYIGGNIALLPVEDGGALAPATHVVQHRGSGPKPQQDSAHAHCIATDPSNRFALAADLGVDRVMVYRLDLDHGTLTHMDGNDAVMRPGAGPRHFAFHPKLPLVYVASELDSTVTTLGFNAESGALTTRDTRSTLPADWTGTSYVADIHLASSGRSLYVSNRGHNSIAVFSVDANGVLALGQVISTDGDWPRNFTLDPTGRWLLVANQRSGSVIVFARDETSGRLTPTSHRLALASPVCLRFRARVA